jgi:hypothetical protein
MARLILKEDIPREQIAEVIRNMGLELQAPSEISNDTEDVFFQQWLTPDQRSGVNHSDDMWSRVPWVDTWGDAEEALADRLGKALPVWEWGPLLTHASALLEDGSADALVRVAYEVAYEMDGNGFDPGGAECLNAFLEKNEPSTRLAGARGFRVLPWRRLRLFAERLAADSDPAIAELAGEWLEEIRELHGDEPPNPMLEALLGSNGDGTFGSWLPAKQRRNESGEGEP